MSGSYSQTLNEVAFALAESGRYEAFESLAPALAEVFGEKKVERYRSNARIRALIDQICRSNFREGWS